MKYILGTLIVVMGMAGVAFGECSAADRAALETFDRDWGKATTSGDRAAMMNFYADDFTGLPGMIGKTAAIDNAVKNFERNKTNPNPDKVTHDHYLITCTPNSATITHRNVVWTPDGMGGKPETFYTRSIHILEKRGAKWQVVSNPPAGDMDDYGVLWYLEQDWNNAFWKRDKKWFQDNFASDFRSISSMTGLISNKDEEIATMISDKSTYDLVETKDMNIRMEGNTAVITGVFHLKGKDEKGVAFDNSLRYTDVWIKRDGRWMAWSSQGTNMK